MESTEMTIVGEIIFTNDPPKGQLPKPSQLVVKICDCTREDAAEVDVAIEKVDAHKMYQEGEPLTFKLFVPKFMLGFEYDMSAVLNVGWVPDDSKEEWIRKGDYLNDTHHTLKIDNANKSKKKYKIEVVHYT